MRDYGIWVKYRNMKGCAEEGRKDRVKPHPSSQTTQPGERCPPHRRRRVKRALDSTRDPKGCQPQPQAISQSLLWLLSGSPEPRIPPPPPPPWHLPAPMALHVCSWHQVPSGLPWTHTRLTAACLLQWPRRLPGGYHSRASVMSGPRQFPLNQETCSPP